MARPLFVQSEFQCKRFVDQHALDAEIERHPQIHLGQAADSAARELTQRCRIFSCSAAARALVTPSSTSFSCLVNARTASTSGGIKLWRCFKWASMSANAVSQR